MADVVIYNPDDTVVANRVTDYLLSVNTPDYEDNPVALINPDLSAVESVAQKYWKNVGGSVVEMVDNEKAALDTFLQAKTIKEKKFQVQTYTNQLLTSEAWYNVDNGGGSYSVKVEETTYTYTNGKAMSKTIKTFYFDGTEASSETWAYYTDGTKQLLKKVG
jgi:hypothetical protein